MAQRSYPMTPEQVLEFRREPKKVHYFGRLVTIRASDHTAGTIDAPQQAVLEVIEDSGEVLAYIDRWSDTECMFWSARMFGLTVGTASDNLADGFEPILNRQR